METTPSTIREMLLYADAAFLISVRYFGYHIRLAAGPQWAPHGGKAAGSGVKNRSFRGRRQVLLTPCLVAAVYGVSLYLESLPWPSGHTRDISPVPICRGWVSHHTENNRTFWK